MADFPLLRIAMSLARRVPLVLRASVAATMLSAIAAAGSSGGRLRRLYYRHHGTFTTGRRFLGSPAETAGRLPRNTHRRRVAPAAGSARRYVGPARRARESKA